MAEFKKLSEVDVLETASDNATVLIEESGEIKRVPKSEVGGAGGYVIKLSESYMDDNGHYCIESNYDEIYDVLVAGGSVWVDFTDRPQSAPMISAPSIGLYSATNWGEMTSLIVTWCLTDVGLALYDWDGVTIYFPNGSHNLEHMVYED